MDRVKSANCWKGTKVLDGSGTSRNPTLPNIIGTDYKRQEAPDKSQEASASSRRRTEEEQKKKKKKRRTNDNNSTVVWATYLFFGFECIQEARKKKKKKKKRRTTATQVLGQHGLLDWLQTIKNQGRRRRTTTMLKKNIQTHPLSTTKMKKDEEMYNIQEIQQQGRRRRRRNIRSIKRSNVVKDIHHKWRDVGNFLLPTFLSSDFVFLLLRILLLMMLLWLKLSVTDCCPCSSLYTLSWVVHTSLICPN